MADLINDAESIKLYKNETIKGGVKYNWDIKLIGKIEDNLARLKDLNNSLMAEYGSNSNIDII